MLYSVDNGSKPGQRCWRIIKLIIGTGIAAVGVIYMLRDVLNSL
ncbi:MAG TPA: hypothetical protein VFZ52_12620 [Chryseolinea sp.]